MRTDHRETEEEEEDGEKSEGGIIYGDVLVLMSAPLLGSFNLTFMFRHSILLPIFFLLIFLFSFILFISSLFTHYPVSSPFALHESYTHQLLLPLQLSHTLPEAFANTPIFFNTFPACAPLFLQSVA